MGMHRIRLPVSERISIPQTEWLRNNIPLNLNADRNANYALAA